jgi:hypothetical protein
MTNTGSQQGSADIITVNKLWGIKEGEIKNFGYDHTNNQWLKMPSGTSADPLFVDISGAMPDTVDLTKIGGNTVETDAGNHGAGTLRVAIATDDVNLSSIGSSVSPEGTAATKGIQMLLDNGTDSVFAQADTNGYLKTIGMPHPNASATWSQLTEAGVTDAATVTGYIYHVIQYKVASINTNVIVRAEGSLDGTDFFNLNEANLDTTQTSDGTYGMCYTGGLQKIRFRFVSESGGSDVTVDAKYLTVT